MSQRRPIAFVALLISVVLAHGAAARSGGQPASIRIIASAAAPWVVSGGPVSIRGNVVPRRPGVGITLEQERGGTWAPVSAKKTAASGDFVFINRPSNPGTATFRVVASPNTSYAGISASVPVQVLEWTYLANVYVRPSAGELDTDPIVSDGVSYQHPVALDAGCYNAWNGDAWVNYELGRRYQTLIATVGLPDTALPGSTASFNVLGDGKTLASGNLVPGMSTKIRVSLSGVSRLRLLSNVPDPTGAAGCSNYYLQIVFGDAQLLGP